MHPDRLLARVRAGHLDNVSFRDFTRLLDSLGFRRTRVRGSHHIYAHPLAERGLPVQPLGRDAKRYQIAQLLKILAEYPGIEEGASR